jgi:hypothetical protein
MTTINWDAIELLPRFDCCVCSTNAVPWGRTLDDRYFCSAKCCSADDETRQHGAARRPRFGTRKLSRPAPGARLFSKIIAPGHPRIRRPFVAPVHQRNV